MNEVARRSSRLRTAALSAVVAGCALAGAFPLDAQSRSRRQLSGEDRRQLLILSSVVDGIAKGQTSAPADVGLFWTSHFLKAADNLVYVPYTLSIDGTFQSRVAMYVRVVRRGASRGEYDQSAMTMGTWRNLTERPGQLTADLKDLRAKAITREPHAFEDVVTFDQAPNDRVSRALWVQPGEYDVYVALQEQRGRAKTTVLREYLKVPDFSSEFTASTVILADSLEPAAPARDVEAQLETPFLIDRLRIAPLHTAVLAPGRTLNVVFWIYNESIDVDGYPDVEVDFSFYRKTGPGEAFFNRTPPKSFNAATVPADFNLSAAHQIQVVQSIPLASFPAGDYRLAITLADNVTRRTSMRDVNVVIAP